MRHLERGHNHKASLIIFTSILHACMCILQISDLCEFHIRDINNKIGFACTDWRIYIFFRYYVMWITDYCSPEHKGYGWTRSSWSGAAPLSFHCLVLMQVRIGKLRTRHTVLQQRCILHTVTVRVWSLYLRWRVRLLCILYTLAQMFKCHSNACRKTKCAILHHKAPPPVKHLCSQPPKP